MCSCGACVTMQGHPRRDGEGERKLCPWPRPWFELKGITERTEERSRAALASSHLWPVQLSLCRGWHLLLLECGDGSLQGLCCSSVGLSTEIPSWSEKSRGSRFLPANSTGVLLAALARHFPPSLALCITPAFTLV